MKAINTPNFGLAPGPRHDDILFKDKKSRVRRRWPDGTRFDAGRGIITGPDGTEISYDDWWRTKQ